VISRGRKRDRPVLTVADEAEGEDRALEEDGLPGHRRRGGRWRSHAYRERRPSVEVWTLSGDDRGWLQLGWLFLFVALAAALFGLSWLWLHAEAPTDASQRAFDCISSNISLPLYEVLWGGGVLCTLINSLIISLAVLNYILFALTTEVAYDPEATLLGMTLDSWACAAHEYVKFSTFILFFMILFMRIPAVQSHPQWKKRGRFAWLWYFAFDFYVQMDILGIVATLLEYIFAPRIRCLAMNFLWLSVMRLGELLRGHGLGIGFKSVSFVARDQMRLLFLVLVLGAVTWILVSGLYFVANSKNPDSVWLAAEVNGRKWQRFESIPSSMWFVLLNLCREQPLSSVHNTGFQRALVVFVNVFGVHLFALPTGILGSSLASAGIKELMGGGGNEPSDSAQNAAGEQNVADGDADATGRAASGADCVTTGAMADLEDKEWTDGEWVWEDETTEEEGEEKEARPLWEVWLTKEVAERLVTGSLAFGSVYCFFLRTAGKVQLFFFQVHVTEWMASFVDGVVGTIFAMEWVWRLQKGRWAYTQSLLGIIDFVSAWPGVIHFFLQLIVTLGIIHQVELPSWFPALCVIRVMKLERWMHSLRDMTDVVSLYKPVLICTGYVATILWLIFSVALYLTEHSSYDVEIQENFGSVVRSMWAEIVNLHGEWIWCDFSAEGKAIGMLIAFFSISICVVPLSVFSAGYFSKFHVTCLEFDAYDMAPWQTRHAPQCTGMRQDAYQLLYAHKHSTLGLPYRFQLFRAISFFLSVTNVFVSILLTNEYFLKEQCELKPRCRLLSMAFFALDFLSLAFFTMEFILRCCAISYWHMLSAIGWCDLLSLCALALSLTPLRYTSLRPESQANFCSYNLIVPIRILRLFCLESYVGCLHILKHVLWLNGRQFLRSFYALVSVWWVYATFLHLFESDNHQKQDYTDDLTQADRYRNVLSSLQYALIHLTGDFPLTVYTFQAKIVHCFGIIFGMCCMATWTGIFSVAYINYVENERIEQLASVAEIRMILAIKMAIRIQREFRRRRALHEKRCRRATFVTPDSAQLQNLRPASVWTLQVWRKHCKTMYARRTRLAQLLMGTIDVVLVVNVTKTVLSTLPQAETSRELQIAFFVIEILCTIVFCVEYMIALGAGGMSSFLSWHCMLKLVMLIPAFLLLFVEVGVSRRMLEDEGERYEVEIIMEFLLVCRVIRVLAFPGVRRDIVTVLRALRSATGNLLAPSFLAFNVWLFTTCLFVWEEQYYQGPAAKEFSSVFGSMYWTSDFIIGEWTITDFTPGAGSRLCIFYCLFAMMVFSMPAAIMVEAMHSTLVMVATEHMELHELEKAKVEEAQGRVTSRSMRKSRRSTKGMAGGTRRLTAGFAAEAGDAAARRASINAPPLVTVPGAPSSSTCPAAAAPAMT